MVEHYIYKQHSMRIQSLQSSWVHVHMNVLLKRSHCAPDGFICFYFYLPYSHPGDITVSLTVFIRFRLHQFHSNPVIVTGWETYLRDSIRIYLLRYNKSIMLESAVRIGKLWPEMRHSRCRLLWCGPFHSFVRAVCTVLVKLDTHYTQSRTHAANRRKHHF